MKETDQTVHDAGQSADEADQTTRFAAVGDGRPAAHRWAGDDAASDDSAAPEERFGDDLYAGLTSLGFIQAALRRRVWLWCSLALIGLAAGFALLTFTPANYQAQTSLFLSPPPDAALGWILDDQAIAQSRTVAGIAIRDAGLRMSAADLVKHYMVTSVSNRILEITVTASSGKDALREATALRVAYLKFQANLLNTQEKLVDESLTRQLAQARQRINSLNSQITALSAQPVSSSQQAKLTVLEAKRSQASNTLTGLKQTINTDEAANRVATTAAVKGSVRLEKASLVKQSKKKRMALFIGGGLLAGLVIGIGIVVLGALMSDRLRRRDEIARALGAPVRLSVRKVKLSRWRGAVRAAGRDPRLRRVVAYLSRAVAPSSGEPASLAVVPVGEVRVAAACVASLALGHAREGLRVVLADLSPGAPAARMLGAPPATGVLKVDVDDTRLVVAIPDRDDIVPAGPLRRGRAQAEEQLAAACASADLVLTLTTLDPELGSEHLAGWAASAVAVVTAGASSAAGVHAAGEMLRLAGMSRVSAVLIGADKADESLGLTRVQQAARDGMLAANGRAADAGEFFSPVNGSRTAPFT